MLTSVAEKELQQSKDEKEGLQARIKDQGLSPAEVERMTSEHRSLEEQLMHQRMAVDKLQRQYSDIQVSNTKLCDAVEALVIEYNKSVYDVGLAPAPPSGFDHIDFELSFSRVASSNDMLSVDIRSVVSQALLTIYKQTTQAFHDISNEADVARQALELLNEKIGYQQEEVQASQSRKALLDSTVQDEQSVRLISSPRKRPSLIRLSKSACNKNTQRRSAFWRRQNANWPRHERTLINEMSISTSNKRSSKLRICDRTLQTKAMSSRNKSLPCSTN